MNKKFTKLMAALALLLFIAPPLVGWGQTRDDITLTANSGFGSSYGTNHTFTVSGIGFKDSGVMYNAKNTPTEWAVKQLIQMRKSGSGAGEIYNTTGISTITSVVVTLVTANNNFTIYYGTSENPSTNSIASSTLTPVQGSFSYTNINNQTATATSYTYTFDLSSFNPTHFRIVNGSNASYVGSIVINYSSGYTVTYDCNGGTSDCPDPLVVNNVPAGNYTLASAPSRTDYTFDGWNDGTTTYEAGATYPISQNVTFTAQWTPTFDYISVAPTSFEVPVVGDVIEMTMTTNIASPSYVVVYYTTAECTESTNKPEWFGDVEFSDNTLDIEVNENDGAARQAYFKVKSGEVESEVVTVNQAAITVATPVFDVAAGTYYEDQLVHITCATSGATIRYTTDGTTPTASSTEYDGNGVEITENTTLKAIAIKNSVSSEVATATYTIIHPLTTMDAIFEAATNNGSTASNVNVTFGNWVVSGVSGSNVFVTDNSGKGFIIYKNGHGFTIYDKLSGTVMGTPLKLYNGSAEFTNLTTSSTGLSVSHNGEITIITDKTIADLGGVNTGAVITLNNLTYDGTNLSDGTNTIKPYNTLYSGMSFTTGKTYNVTGVYQQFGNTKEILPRSANDIVEVLDPTISVNPSSAETFSYIVGGGPSEEQVFQVTGSFLTSDDIIVSVPEDCAFEITDEEEYGYTITIGSGDVFSVRMKAGLEVGSNYSTTLTIINDGAETVSMPLTGSVTNQTYTISDLTGSWGEITFSPSATVEAGAQVTLTVVPGDAYYFIGTLRFYNGTELIQTVTNASNPYVYTMPAYNVNVAAELQTKTQYNITTVVNPTAGGTVVTDDTAWEGKVVEIAVEAAVGYALSSLTATYVDSNDETQELTITNNTFVMPAYAVTVTATFEEYHAYEVDFESATTAYPDWTFTNMTSQGTNSNVTAHGGSYFGTTGGKTTASIQTKSKIANPTALTCYVSKQSDNTTSSTWYIQVSSDGTNWTTVAERDATDMTKGEWKEFKVESFGNYSNVYVRVYYSGSTAVRCIDDLSLTYTPAASYALNVVTVEHGTITATVGSATVAEGGSFNVENLAVVTLNAEADENYQFDSWTVCKTGDATTTVEVNNNQFIMPDYAVTVSASFIATWPLTYNVNGHASTINVPAGTFNLSAPTENIPANFDFVGWTTNPANVADLITSIDMTAAATVYAVFSKSSTLTLTGSDFDNAYPVDEKDYVIGGITFAANQVASYENGTFQFKKAEGYLYNKDALGELVSIVATQSGTYRSGMTLKAGNTVNPVDADAISAAHESGTMVDYYDLSNISSPYIYMNNTSGYMVKYSSIVFNFNNPNPARYTRVFLNETATADITIVGPSIVPSGSTLNMGNNTLSNTAAANLIIEDGAQYYGNGVKATMQKVILPYSTEQGDNDKWYAISMPFNYGINPGIDGYMTEMVTDVNSEPTYDFYRFDNIYDGAEWRNFRQNDGFGMTIGQGYLYAHKNGITLNFTGTLNATSENVQSVGFNNAGNAKPFADWFFAGNPFSCNATIDGFADFYVINEVEGKSEFTLSEGGILNPLEGAMIYDQNAAYNMSGSYQITYVPASAPAPSNVSNNTQSMINLSVSRNSGGLIDCARVRFDEGGMLPKFQLNPNSTKLYIPQGSKDYAVVRSNAQGEMPVSFKAENNGTYTISVNAENVEMNYLHLIDNMTGADVDLLATPSYTFEAKTIDYASRFRLVFSANDGSNEEGNETFAYYNGSEWMINNMGEATLQVVDVMGRVLSTETVSGNATINLNQMPGVYMLRLVNGDSVKVQKVVVR